MFNVGVVHAQCIDMRNDMKKKITNNEKIQQTWDTATANSNAEFGHNANQNRTAPCVNA